MFLQPQWEQTMWSLRHHNLLYFIYLFKSFLFSLITDPFIKKRLFFIPWHLPYQLMSQSCKPPVSFWQAICGSCLHCTPPGRCSWHVRSLAPIHCPQALLSYFNHLQLRYFPVDDSGLIPVQDMVLADLKFFCWAFSFMDLVCVCAISFLHFILCSSTQCLFCCMIGTLSHTWHCFYCIV